ncbi:sigma-70 family RNA polymerase sigma factor [Paenibacillus sp. FSL E2-0202]|uniref:sigma-70 family RNA polymerase sigma factor n=1 Tax=Paenibacillus sp. FSL E2-0202 TaxID=2954505 RepID=UPI0030EE591B
MGAKIDYNPHLGYKDDVILRNLGLVHHIANKFRNRINQGFGYEDLASEGTIGLIKAFEYFDPSKVKGEIRFVTYASHMIQGYIQNFLAAKGSSVKTPRSILQAMRVIVKTNLIDASTAEIVEKTGLTLDEAKDGLLFLENQKIASLDFQIDDENESSILLSMIPSADDSTHLFVTEFIENLKDRDQVIIKMLMNGANQRNIAEELGVTQSYISRLILRIGKRYKKYMVNPESGEFKLKTRNTTSSRGIETNRRESISILDEIEWFSSEISLDVPSVSLNSLGVHINRPALEELGLAAEGYIQVGFNSELMRLVIRKANVGIKLNKTTGKTGAVATNNKRIGKWLDAKNAERKRYMLQYDETAQVHFIQIELGPKGA